MTPEEVLKAFEEHGVVLRGHFKLTSGRHSDVYLQKQRAFEDPQLTMRLAAAIVGRFPKGSFDVVAAPAVGAISLGAFVAYAAGVRFVFTERADGAMTLRRGQHLDRGERVLVVEDIVTTGGSAGEVVAMVEAFGATVAGVAVLADRTEKPPPYAMTALVRFPAVSWPADECPLCAEGRPIDAPGSRHLSPS
jgi:orotate phosphoribosyltransferase